MKKGLQPIIVILMILLFYLLLVKSQLVNLKKDNSIQELADTLNQPAYDNPTEYVWPELFERISIPSEIDSFAQNAFFYKSTSTEPQPLIVSLHTWSGDYTQQDPLASLCVERNVNYIHPDFRGANDQFDACCSDLVISDIDQSIQFALEEANVKPSATYVIGVSGGGHATLCMLMKSRQNIKIFSAWVPIGDLVAWYNESSIRKNKYAEDILKCTNSNNGVLNLTETEKRSPQFFDTPLEKMENVKVFIHTGIYDGIQGSVPITQSINFYNKLVTDLKADKSCQVNDYEKLFLLEHRKPLYDFDSMGGRKLFLNKSYKNIQLQVFEGNHEILPDYALDQILQE